MELSRHWSGGSPAWLVSEGLARPTVFVVEWCDPIFNAGHWTPELVRLAGGTPMLAAEGRDSVRVPWEELREADPEIVVVACCGHAVERIRRDVPILEALPGWSGLRAVRDRPVGTSPPSRRAEITTEVRSHRPDPVTRRPTRPAAWSGLISTVLAPWSGVLK